MLTLDPDWKYERRFRLSPFINIHDIADYKVGWLLSVPFLKMLRLKVSKIMESPKYITIIKIFNTEYEKT